MNTILFDDNSRIDLLPLTFTRPVAGLRWGILTLWEKWEKHLAQPCSFLTQDYLQEKYPLETGNDNLFINGSFHPDRDLLSAILALKPAGALFSGDELIALRTAEKNLSLQDISVISKKYRKANYEGTTLKLRHLWDLFMMNSPAIKADFDLLTLGRRSQAISLSVNIVGNQAVFLEEGARMEYATINTRNGPVYIGREAEVMEGCLVRGPFSLGDHAVLKMGTRIYGPTSIGPSCKAGGEINQSLIFGFSNKSHDGYLGNSVIGEWCNLGADTNNSNLRNNFAPVRLWNYRNEAFSDTGLLKCGLFMGDHSRSGINTMFNTATVVGIGTNLYGAGYPPAFIPSFTMGEPATYKIHPPEKLFIAASNMMKLQNRELSETDKRILVHVFEQTEHIRAGNL